MKTNFILFIVICFVFSGCKKNSSTPSPSTPLTPPTVTPTSSAIYGHLEVADRSYWLSGDYFHFPDKQIYVFFSTQNIYPLNTLYNTPGGDVTLNNYKLKTFYISIPPVSPYFSYQYYDSTRKILVGPYHWNVSGSTNVPAFTATINDPIPVCNNPLQLPDTVSFSTGISIPISGSGADSVSLEYYGDSNNAGDTKVKTVGAANAVVSLSSQELSTFFNNPNDKFYSVRISYKKYQILNFGGKNIEFVTIKSYGRNIVSKP